MADLEDLGFLSITEMANDEQLELLRQVRLNRRTSVKQATTTIKRKPVTKVDASQAAELLRILGGNTDD